MNALLESTKIFEDLAALIEADALPHGVEILDLAALIKAELSPSADSLEASEAVAEHIKGLDRSSTDGGVHLSRGELLVLTRLANTAAGAARAAHLATLTVASAHLHVKRRAKLTPDRRPMLTPLGRGDGAVPIGAEP